MAVISQFNKEDEDKQQGTSGAVGGSTAPTLGAVGAPAAQKPASSGQFTNVNKFIEANRGAGTNLANKATGNIARNIQETQGKVQNVGALGGAVQGEEQRIATADAVKSQIQANPTTLTADTNTFQGARDLITGKTQAEQQKTDLQTRTDAAANALGQSQQQVQNLGTESGRFNLLRKAVGGPGYSAGQQRLDQLLFQTEGAPVIGQKQNQFTSDLAKAQEQKTGFVTDLSKRINDYNTLAATKATELTGELGTQKQNLTQAQIDEALTLNNSRVAYNQAMDQLRNSGYDSLTGESKKIIDAELQKSGTRADMRTYGLLGGEGYKDYFKAGKTDLTQADVLDQQELARYDALARLSDMKESERQFTKAGDRGQESQILLNELKTASGARRAQLEQQLNRIEASSPYSFNNSTNIRAFGNLKDLLDFKEGSRADIPINVRSELGNNYNRNISSVRSAPVNPNGTGAAISELGGYFDDGALGGVPSRRLWEQFQKELDTANYYENLGKKNLTRGLEPQKVKKQGV